MAVPIERFIIVTYHLTNPKADFRTNEMHGKGKQLFAVCYEPKRLYFHFGYARRADALKVRERLAKNTNPNDFDHSNYHRSVRDLVPTTLPA